MQDLLSAYTIDQVFLFYRAAREIENKAALNSAVVTRVAQHADAKAWNDFVTRLTTAMKERKEAILTKEKAKALARILGGR